MSECKCLSMTYDFSVYRKIHHKTKLGNIFGDYTEHWTTDCQIVTIHGETLEEIKTKKQQICDELSQKYPEIDFVIKVWIK